MTLLVPTTSGGWKALAVVAQSAAAAAALVGDLTMVSVLALWRQSPYLCAGRTCRLGKYPALREAKLVAQAGSCHYKPGTYYPALRSRTQLAAYPWKILVSPGCQRSSTRAEVRTRPRSTNTAASRLIARVFRGFGIPSESEAPSPTPSPRTTRIKRRKHTLSLPAARSSRARRPPSPPPDTC